MSANIYVATMHRVLVDGAPMASMARGDTLADAEAMADVYRSINPGSVVVVSTVQHRYTARELRRYGVRDLSTFEVEAGVR